MARANTAVVFHTLYTDLLAMSTPGVGVMAVTTTPTFRFALIYESNNFPRLTFTARISNPTCRFGVTTTTCYRISTTHHSTPACTFFLPVRCRWGFSCKTQADEDGTEPTSSSSCTQSSYSLEVTDHNHAAVYTVPPHSGSNQTMSIPTGVLKTGAAYSWRVGVAAIGSGADTTSVDNIQIIRILFHSVCKTCVGVLTLLVAGGRGHQPGGIPGLHATRCQFMLTCAITMRRHRRVELVQQPIFLHCHCCSRVECRSSVGKHACCRCRRPVLCIPSQYHLGACCRHHPFSNRLHHGKPTGNQAESEGRGLCRGLCRRQQTVVALAVVGGDGNAAIHEQAAARTTAGPEQSACCKSTRRCTCIFMICFYFILLHFFSIF